MKFYIASSLNNKQQVTLLSNRLKEEGFTHTYDWTKNGRVVSVEKLSKIGELERNGVMNSDFFILLLPGGLGSHTELGMAIAGGKRIYIYSETIEPFNPEKTTTFYHINGIYKFVGDFEDFIKEILLVENKFNLA